MDINQKHMRSKEWNPKELLKKSLVTNIAPKLLNNLLNLVALSFVTELRDLLCQMLFKDQ